MKIAPGEYTVEQLLVMAEAFDRIAGVYQGRDGEAEHCQVMAARCRDLVRREPDRLACLENERERRDAQR